MLFFHTQHIYNTTSRRRVYTTKRAGSGKHGPRSLTFPRDARAILETHGRFTVRLFFLFFFLGNRGRHPGPVQHNPDHGQLHVAGPGDAAGGHAERVEVQRRAVDTRLSGRVRGEGGAVHARRAERHPGRGQLGAVAEPAAGGRRQGRLRRRPVRAQHAADGRPVAAHVPADAVQRQRARPERQQRLTSVEHFQVHGLRRPDRVRSPRVVFVRLLSLSRLSQQRHFRRRRSPTTPRLGG